MRIDWQKRRAKAALGAAAVVYALLVVAGAYQTMTYDVHAAEGQRWGGPDRRGPGVGIGRGRGGRPGALLPPLRQLDLSDEQLDQVREVVGESRDAGRETARAMRAARRALGEATAAEELDEDRIRALAAELGRLEGDAAVGRARLYAAVWRMLTPDQQARAGEIRAERQERREERRGRLRERLEERLEDLGR